VPYLFEDSHDHELDIDRSDEPVPDPTEDLI
jgi:hypothetical protein